MKQARGMRNNNPLNIIKSEKINWQGEVKPSTDPNFAQFETLEYGLRAAFKLLRTYYTKHGCKTITQIISRWAPETENQVVAYIKAVSQRTGIAPDAPLPPMKQETQVLWCDIVLAMAMVECGLNGREQEELAPYVVRGWILTPTKK